MRLSRVRLGHFAFPHLMPEKVALLLDGGFVKKKLRHRQGQIPAAEDITALCTEILAKPRLGSISLRYP